MFLGINMFLAKNVFMPANVNSIVILYFNHDDFTGKSVRFNDETLRSKRERTRQIVHVSCLNVSGSRPRKQVKQF